VDEPLSIAEALELRNGLEELRALDSRLLMEEHRLLTAGEPASQRLMEIRRLRGDIAATLAAANETDAPGPSASQADLTVSPDTA
jgi:hypothetical protein